MFKNHSFSIHNLEIQVGQLANSLSIRNQGSLPSNIEKNPKEQLKAITLRSGIEIPTPKQQLSMRKRRKKIIKSREISGLKLKWRKNQKFRRKIKKSQSHHHQFSLINLQLHILRDWRNRNMINNLQSSWKGLRHSISICLWWNVFPRCRNMQSS